MSEWLDAFIEDRLAHFFLRIEADARVLRQLALDAVQDVTLNSYHKRRAVTACHRAIFKMETDIRKMRKEVRGEIRGLGLRDREAFDVEFNADAPDRRVDHAKRMAKIGQDVVRAEQLERLLDERERRLGGDLDVAQGTGEGEGEGG